MPESSEIFFYKVRSYWNCLKGAGETSTWMGKVQKLRISSKILPWNWISKKLLKCYRNAFRNGAGIKKQ